MKLIKWIIRLFKREKKYNNFDTSDYDDWLC